jgi:hypothetical protein
MIGSNLVKGVVAAAVLGAGVAVVHAGQCHAGTCWYETSRIEKPWSCQTVGITPQGKYLLICCN